MKERKFLTSTLLVAAAMGLGTLPTFAAGDGSQGNPYAGTINGLDISGFEAGTTVYIDGWTSGYWVQASGGNDDYKYITFVANIEIGANGMTLTNAYSETEYTFAGNISGVGDWIFNGPSASTSTPTQRYVFLGDMSDYSGHMSITAASSARWRGYLHFGEGGQAATDTNISGTGSITTTSSGSNDIDIVFNYGSYADAGSTAITIGNSYISTNSLEFTGTVNYIVSSDLIGTGNNSALKITNGAEGATNSVKVTGNISGFNSVTVGEYSTLELAGDVELSNAISNSGTVVVDSTVRFAIDNLTGTEVGDNSYTYTFVTNSGDGSITGWSGLDYDNFTLDGVDIGRSIIEVGEVDGQITITFVAGEDLTWNGIGEDNVWENLGTNWKDGDGEGTFYNHDSVTFGAIGDSGISSTVVIAETMSTGSIAVQDSYTFTSGDENGVTVKTSTLTVDEGSVLTVGDGVTIYVETVGSFSVNGAITGTGTLEFDFDTSYSTSINLGSSNLASGTDAFSGTIYIHSGNIELDLSDIGNGGYIFADGVNAKVSGAITIPTLTLEGETTLQKANNTNTDTSVSITNLTLENGAILTFYTTDSNPSTYKNQGLYIGELTLTGSWAEIRTQNWQNYISITSLIGENATLYLGSTAGSSATNLYELGTSGNTSSTSLFTGKIVLSDSDSGSRRSVGLVISEQYIAAGAVIEMGTEASGDGTLSLGVNASTVEIAGLVSSSNHGGTDIVYSGAVTTGTDLGANGTNLINHSGDNYSGVSASVNTLVINVDDGESYEFHGIILDSLNIEKKGAGTQAIEFQANSSFNGKVTVSAGTLSLSSAEDVTVTTGEITVAASATLNLENISIELSSAIQNSGSIIISDTTFVLDSLEGGYSSEYNVGYYEIVTGVGSTDVTYNESTLVFINDGNVLEGWKVWQDTETGNVYVYGSVGNIIWAGTDPNNGGNNNWSTNKNDLTWNPGGSENTYFIDGSDVVFGLVEDGSPYNIVNVVGTVEAGTIMVNDNYTFTTSEGSTAVVGVNELQVAEGKTLTIDEGVTLYFDQETFTNFTLEIDGTIAGTGTIEIDLTNNTYASTINLGTNNTFAGTVYVHSGEFHLYGSDIGNGTYRLGDGVNIEIATSGVSVSNDFIFEGTTMLHVNSGDSLTISGNISGDAITDNVTPTIDRHGAGTLVLAGNVDIDAFTIDSSVNTTGSTTTFSGGTVNIGSLNVNGVGNVIFSPTDNAESQTVTIGKLTVSGNSSTSYDMTFSGAVTATIGEYNYERFHVENGAVLDLTNANYTASGNGYIYIDGEGSTVKVSELKWGEGSSFGASMWNNRIQLSNGGVLEVTTAQSSGDGGGERAFAVTSGEGTYRFSGTGTSYLHSTERNIHVADGATLIFDVVDASATLDVSMQIASGLGNDSDVGSGSRTTSTGSLVKTGAGTLILEATNLYSGGTTVEQGTLVVQNGSALGSGSVSVTNSSTLELDVHLTVSVSESSNVTFNEGTRLALGGDLLSDIIGSVDEDTGIGDAVAVITANDISFGSELVSSYEDDLSTLVNQYVSVSGYILTWTWDSNDSTLYVVASMPEPSMFGLMFGFASVGLVATRRRRRKAA